MKPGDCFYHEFTGIGGHYFVALTRQAEDGTVWIATFSTLRRSRPGQCVLTPAECPVLRHDSVVMLSHARRFSARGLGRTLGEVAAVAWHRVLDAASVSDELPEDCRQAMIGQGLIEDC
jgi:hypothetical protein